MFLPSDLAILSPHHFFMDLASHHPCSSDLLLAFFPEAQFSLKVLVRDLVTRRPLARASVDVYLNHTSKSSARTGEDGDVLLRVPYNPGVCLTLLGSKEGYVPTPLPWSTTKRPSEFLTETVPLGAPSMLFTVKSAEPSASLTSTLFMSITEAPMTTHKMRSAYFIDSIDVSPDHLCSAQKQGGRGLLMGQRAPLYCSSMGLATTQQEGGGLDGGWSRCFMVLVFQRHLPFVLVIQTGES